jgi:hypothetical protein
VALTAFTQVREIVLHCVRQRMLSHSLVLMLKQRHSQLKEEYLIPVIDRMHHQYIIFKRDYADIRNRLVSYLNSRKEQDIAI